MVLKLYDCHKFLGYVMVGVAQIFFCIFTPSVTLKMEAVCSSIMFEHTYCILNGVRTQKTIMSSLYNITLSPTGCLVPEVLLIMSSLTEVVMLVACVGTQLS